MNAKERLHQNLVDLGYTPGDSEQTQQVRRPYTRDGWTITLVYNVIRTGGGWTTRGKEGNTLQRVLIDGPESVSMRLQRPSRSRFDLGYEALWEALDDGTDSRPLSARALLLAEDPGLAVWVADELDHKRRARIKAHDDAIAAPLPIRVKKHEYDFLLSRLDASVKRLRRANGLTDLPAEYATARALFDELGTILDTDTTSASEPPR